MKMVEVASRAEDDHDHRVEHAIEGALIGGATPSRRGRKTRLNQDLVDRLCLVLASGTYIETACHLVGLGVTTFHRWMREAEEPGASKELRQFRSAVEKARATAEAQAVSQILHAAERGHWQAAAWWLERSFPARWGRRRAVSPEVSGPAAEPIRLEEAVRLAMAAFGPEANPARAEVEP